MVYKDMTFCEFWNKCVRGNKCHRALTPDVKKNAFKLDMLIAKYVEKPTCFVSKERFEKIEFPKNSENIKT